jgi:prolyl oligopeptidase
MGQALALILLVGTMTTVRAQEQSDPRAWLEDVTSEKALNWVRQRNAASTAELAKNPEFEALDTRLLRILDSKDKIPFITKEGAWYYNFWRDDKNQRGLWRRTSLEEYRKVKPNWETVLDMDALGREEKENWVWHGANFLFPSYERALISLSRGGADASVVREFDIASKSFVKDGFTLPEAKNQVTWKNHDSLLVGTNFGKDSLTKSGYPRISKEWRRGTPLSDARLVFEGKPDDVSAGVGWDPTPGFEREIAYRAVTFYTNEMFVLRGGQFVRVDKPDDAEASFHREWMFLTLRTDWQVAGKTWKAGSLLAIKDEAFAKGDRRFDLLFEPSERKSLASFSNTRSHLILNELDNVCNRLFVLTPHEGSWRRKPLGSAAPLSSINASAVDSIESDDYFLMGSNFLTPSNLVYGTLSETKSFPPEELKSAPKFFDAAGLEVSQHEAVSKDGTKVPYFMIARKKLELNGSNPTLLYGYGGFEISLTPNYSALAGAAWMEKGGVYVVANIRGGGEFGPKWHQAALKENRHRAYEDFAAVAEDLVKRKITTPKHLGAMGGSNGGLLMGNMLTLYPQLFGAIVCQVPLLDMQRYNKLLAGASWMAEYGNPDEPKEWEFIKTFSPYHNAQKDAQYPRTLFTTSTRDDRVHPGHARKMVAKLLEMGHDVLLYENIEGGHGGAADNKQAAFMQALAYTFLWKQLANK